MYYLSYYRDISGQGKGDGYRLKRVPSWGWKDNPVIDPYSGGHYQSSVWSLISFTNLRNRAHPAIFAALNYCVCEDDLVQPQWVPFFSMNWYPTWYKIRSWHVLYSPCDISQSLQDEYKTSCFKVDYTIDTISSQRLFHPTSFTVLTIGNLQTRL